MGFVGVGKGLDFNAALPDTDLREGMGRSLNVNVEDRSLGGRWGYDRWGLDVHAGEVSTTGVSLGGASTDGASTTFTRGDEGGLISISASGSTVGVAALVVEGLVWYRLDKYMSKCAK